MDFCDHWVNEFHGGNLVILEEIRAYQGRVNSVKVRIKSSNVFLEFISKLFSFSFRPKQTTFKLSNSCLF